MRFSFQPAIDLITELITSPSNPRVKLAASLRDAKGRRRENRFLIDGASSVSMAIAAGVQLTDVFVLDSVAGIHNAGTHHAEISGLLRQLTAVQGGPIAQASQVRWARLAESAMDKLQYGDQRVPVIAVGVPPSTKLEALSSRIERLKKRSEHELYLVLDRLEKPGNLGAAMRTADAAGVTAVLLSDPVSELWNPNAIRASLGAMFTVPLACDSWENLAKWLGDRSVHVYAARTEDGRVYSKMEFPSKSAIVIGNEALGLEDRWKSQGILSVHIPMFGEMNSLNASVTGSILLFEVIRQRQVQ